MGMFSSHPVCSVPALSNPHLSALASEFGGKRCHSAVPSHCPSVGQTPYPVRLQCSRLQQPQVSSSPSLCMLGYLGQAIETLLSRATLTNDPLDPDDVVGIGLRAEVLEATAEVVAHPPAFLPQVALGLGEEVLGHIHHVHSLEEGQQQPLGDAANASPAVQGAGCSSSVGAILE